MRLFVNWENKGGLNQEMIYCAEWTFCRQHCYCYRSWQYQNEIIPDLWCWTMQGVGMMWSVATLAQRTSENCWTPVWISEAIWAQLQGLPWQVSCILYCFLASESLIRMNRIYDTTCHITLWWMLLVPGPTGKLDHWLLELFELKPDASCWAEVIPLSE